jgi:hypothetical protein
MGTAARAINLRSSRSKSLATVRNSYANSSKTALVPSSLIFCASARHASAVCRHSFDVIMAAHFYQFAKQRRAWHPPLVALPALRDLLLSAKYLFV